MRWSLWLPHKKTIQKISKLDKSRKDASSRLDVLTKSRQNGEESVYTKVDKIFQSIGANWAHYFGRAFEGVDIKQIMAKSDDIFDVGGALRQKLLERTSNSYKDVIINKVCDNVGLVFKLWDGDFSVIHLSSPTVEQYGNSRTNWQGQGNGAHQINGI